MRKLTMAALSVLVLGPSGAGAETRRISRVALEDKIRGGWAGLYVEMTFGDMFKASRYELWHANAGARRALNRGFKAPWSGHPRYNLHANDIDFQIGSDFIGLMTPGLPREANKYADRVGRVMNWGDGLYGGMFFGGMYAAAFFESDPPLLRRHGRAIVGRCLQEGGRDLDAWIPERRNDDDYWHVTGLAPGRHTVRIVVRADADPRSTGHEIQIERAIVYAPR